MMNHGASCLSRDGRSRSQRTAYILWWIFFASLALSAEVSVAALCGDASSVLRHYPEHLHGFASIWQARSSFGSRRHPQMQNRSDEFLIVLCLRWTLTWSGRGTSRMPSEFALGHGLLPSPLNFTGRELLQSTQDLHSRGCPLHECRVSAFTIQHLLLKAA